MTKVKITELKTELMIISHNLYKATKRKNLYLQQESYCPILVNTTKRKEAKLIEEYLAIDQLIDDVTGGQFEVTWN